MNRKIIFVTTIWLLILAVPLQAQDFAPVGTVVAQFLEIGLGARGTGMGEAYTALTNDAGSVFWNPAGLADVNNRSLYTTYTRWPADISIGGVACAINLGSIGVVSVSSIYLMTDDMEITTVLQPEGTGQKFGIANYALGLTYARYLTDRLSVGMTAKLIHEKYLSYGYNSWALDMGTIYHTGFHGLNIGMSILHFGPDIRFSGSYIDYSDPKSVDVNKPKTFETYSLPINFRVGTSFDIINTTQNRILACADMIHPNNQLEQYNGGLEYSYNQLFFLRGGYKFTTDVGGLTLGTGIHLNLIGDSAAMLDYSFSSMGILKNIHRISLALTF